jgi:hypothetical protein
VRSAEQQYRHSDQTKDGAPIRISSDGACPAKAKIGAMPATCLLNFAESDGMRGARYFLLTLAFLCPMCEAQERAPAREELKIRGELDYELLLRHSILGSTIRIRSTPGGTGAAAMQLAHMPVIVDGRCNSACAWAFVQNTRACFTRRAVFGFHAAFDPGTGRRMQVATDYWLNGVRASLRPRLEGVLSSQRLVYISAKEMTRHYADRRCGLRPID